MEIKYFKRKTTVFLCDDILETFLSIGIQENNIEINVVNRAVSEQ